MSFFILTRIVFNFYYRTLSTNIHNTKVRNNFAGMNMECTARRLWGGGDGGTDLRGPFALTVRRPETPIVRQFKSLDATHQLLLSTSRHSDFWHIHSVYYTCLNYFIECDFSKVYCLLFTIYFHLVTQVKKYICVSI